MKSKFKKGDLVKRKSYLHYGIIINLDKRKFKNYGESHTVLWTDGETTDVWQNGLEWVASGETPTRDSKTLYRASRLKELP